MNVYTRELRMMRGSLITWAIALSVVVMVFITLYPAFSSDIDASKVMLDKFPSQVRAMFGMSLTMFFTFLGFYAYTFTYITLSGAIQAMNLGVGLLARESMAGTSDFLLSKPVTRTKVYVSKLAAALTVLAITIIIFTLVAYVGAKLMGAGDFSERKFLMLNVAFAAIQLWFLALGMLVSQLVRKVKSVVSISLSFVFGFFIIGMIGGLIGEEKFRYLTPFKFFDYLGYLTSGRHETKFVVLGAVTCLAMVIVSYVLYVCKDVKAAI